MYAFLVLFWTQKWQKHTWFNLMEHLKNASKMVSRATHHQKIASQIDYSVVKIAKVCPMPSAFQAFSNALRE